MGSSAAQRRTAIVEILSQSTEALSASVLASRLKVSRQIVVGDVALLRASGERIIATPRGYLLEKSQPAQGDSRCIRTIACEHHLGDGLARELYTVVDNGGELLDVVVEHPLYGQISAPRRHPPSQHRLRRRGSLSADYRRAGGAGNSAEKGIAAAPA